MKKLQLLTLCLLINTLICFSQQGKFNEELTPSKGHYRGLGEYSAKPSSPREAIDQQKFPYDAASAERRLRFRPYYLEKVELEDFRLPDPPANSSEQTRAELNYLLTLQQQRTVLDVESSLYMAGVFYNVRATPSDSSYSQYRQNLFHIGRSIGTWFNPDNLPLTANLMASVWRDADYFIWGFKYKYLRIRPYVLEPAIENLQETNWAAYPSGHAANSYINAYIFSELAPEFTGEFLKDAYDMAHSREIIGVHYPSDSEASRILARQLVTKLFQQEKFLKDFEEVKKEWTKKARENFIKPSTIKRNPVKSPSCGNQQPSSCARKC